MSACSGSREWRWSRPCAASSRPRSGADGAFPGASQITLASDGTVTIGGAAATRAVPAAGHLLARMLSDDAPVRLRLLVTQATGGGRHIRKPARVLGIARLLRAAESRGHPERAPRTGNRGAGGATAGERRSPSPWSNVRPERLHLNLGLESGAAVVPAAAAILLLAVTGLFVRAGSRNGRLASVVEGLKSAVAAPAESTTTETPESPADIGKDRGTKGAGAAQATAAGAATARGPRRSAARVVSASAITLPLAFEPAPQIVMAQPVLEDVLPAYASYVIEATSVEDSDKIYSRSDASVTPPRQVYPALPADPSPGTRREDLTVLDLVVAADGQVEHVRMRRRRAMSMNSCWSAPPRRGGSSPRRSTGGRSASGIAWRLHLQIEPFSCPLPDTDPFCSRLQSATTPPSFVLSRISVDTFSRLPAAMTS